MKLIFGLHLDSNNLPRVESPTGGTAIVGPRGLLEILETHLGLSGHPDNIDFLRIEQIRQVLALLSKSNKTEKAFFIKSFEADPFATASELLSRRDELLLAGWNFIINKDTPDRLKIIAEIESQLRTNNTNSNGSSLTPGLSDRFQKVLERIPIQGHPFKSVTLNEPFELLPPHYRRLFNLITEVSPNIILKRTKQFAKEATSNNQPVASKQMDLFSAMPSKGIPEKESDLSKFKKRIKGETIQKQTLNCDGSLIILKAKRSNEAAAYIAQLIRLNPSFYPSCLIPEKNRTLDIALIREGLPSLGILSASLARPALQILKLAPTFLWRPIDPFKILEFASLAIKPLPDELATEIARQIARTPGMKGEGWYAVINRYFSKLEESSTPKETASQRKQYEFWFERQQYHMNQKTPKRDALQIFEYIREWAFREFEEGGNKNHSLIVLSEQSRRIVELLQALPESELGYLELERIVRTIYEPSPVTFQEREVNHLPYITNPSAFVDEVEETLWWNFIQNEPPHFFSKWYPKERKYLTSKGVELDTPQQENARLIWQRNRPVLMTKNRLVLVLPEKTEGTESFPHPLFADLEATFENLKTITADISKPSSSFLSQFFELPKWEKVEQKIIG